VYQRLLSASAAAVSVLSTQLDQQYCMTGRVMKIQYVSVCVVVCHAYCLQQQQQQQRRHLAFLLAGMRQFGVVIGNGVNHITQQCYSTSSPLRFGMGKR